VVTGVLVEGLTVSEFDLANLLTAQSSTKRATSEALA
jgi:hypothetical protein